MDFLPSYEDFAAAYGLGQSQAVHFPLAADLDTPVSLMLKLTNAGLNSFMLESVTGGEIRGRYSIVGMEPDLIWECSNGIARINRSLQTDSEAWVADEDGPLASLRKLIDECRIDLPSSLPASSAGLFGYLGYDMVRLVEKLPLENADSIGTPDATLLRPSVVVVLDGVKGDATRCQPRLAPAWPCAENSLRECRRPNPKCNRAPDLAFGNSSAGIQPSLIHSLF